MLSVSHFGHWWAARMAEIVRSLAVRSVPESLRTQIHAMLARRHRPVLVLNPENGTLTLLPRSADDQPEIVTFDLDGLRTLRTRLASGFRRQRPIAARILIPGLMILRRVVRVPLAARAQATSFIGFQIDRITPFPRDELLWSVTPTAGTSPKDGSLDLTLTPRAPVDPWLEALRAGGIRPVSLTAAEGPHAAVIALEPVARFASRTRMMVVASIVMTIVALPFLQQLYVAHRLDTKINTLSGDRLLAEKLRKRLDALTSGAAIIDREARQHGTVLAVLSDLTDALPDDTYLDALTWKAGQLSIDGQSGEASHLITLLGRTHTIHTPGFTGPVLHLPNQRADSFSIHATTEDGVP
ncbi:PilN domain-containing protein [Gluconobacter sp. Dm-62]|uniref:PilN domain-containing protein n=1 Tax=Gluconobacter sp. Dm-62 TaxID=2799804 RepID=UPI001B8C2572|nr:PilN domain-containing protein [Gluconobacter sp. Dm-62]MBS1103329.1 PilN domain-containing protein [Gluconobacter sp. Dm-62]